MSGVISVLDYPKAHSILLVGDHDGKLRFTYFNRPVEWNSALLPHDKTRTVEMLFSYLGVEPDSLCVLSLNKTDIDVPVGSDVSINFGLAIESSLPQWVQFR